MAFFTFMERKILGIIHNRLGPKKLGFFGIFQPFSDAIKLFLKLDFFIKNFVFLIYFCSPFLILLFSLIIWLIFFFWGFLFYINYSFVYFLCLSSFFIYFILYMGWSRGSSFSILGSYRSSAQRVSYEVVLILCILILCFYLMSLSFFILLNPFRTIFVFLGVSIMWLLSCLAERNRSPFDFVEGESELVSGFNTELSGGLFSLIFIREYRSIIFLCFLTCLVFFNRTFMFVFSVFLIFLYVWVRCSFPRLRYDYFLIFGWKGASIYLLGWFFYFL